MGVWLNVTKPVGKRNGLQRANSTKTCSFIATRRILKDASHQLYSFPSRCAWSRVQSRNSSWKMHEGYVLHNMWDYRRLPVVSNIKLLSGGKIATYALLHFLVPMGSIGKQIKCVLIAGRRPVWLHRKKTWAITHNTKFSHLWYHRFLIVKKIVKCFSIT